MTDDDKPTITIGLIGTGRANLRALAGEEAMQPAAIKHPIHHAPALVGTGGRAWLCDTNAGRAKLAAEGRDVSADATVALRVIEAPWAHPAWHTYGLFLVHLRPISGLEKPIFHLNDATHEMWL
jgi:hypothetical protein